MLLTARPHRRPHGFSLLEAVVAGGLILLTVTAVSTCLASVYRGGARHEASMRDDRALRLVAERLSRLPYCAPRLPAPGSPQGASATDLLAAVFPDAGTRPATPVARFVSSSAEVLPAGCFVTRITADGVPVTCVARFRASARGEWLGLDDLSGWDVTTSACPPAPDLEVRLETGDSPERRSVRLELAAGGLAAPEPSQPAAAQ